VDTCSHSPIIFGYRSTSLYFSLPAAKVVQKPVYLESKGWGNIVLGLVMYTIRRFS
jgi:hypothetical protein